MSSDQVIDARVKLAYDESTRALDMQSSTIDELRSRTGVLLATITVAAAFLGAAALEHHRTHGVLWWPTSLAFVGFLAAIGLCLGVLWPVELEFIYGADTLDDYFSRDAPATEMCRAMAYGNGKSWTGNDGRIKRRVTLFRWACAALGLDVLLWLVNIGVR
jgi:hypothetical protein